MILLFSGGLDSYIAWYYLRKPKTLYFDIGHRYCAHEIEVVKKLVPDTIIDSRLNLRDWEEKGANIPMRNAYFLMMATYYDINIVLVVQKGEMDIPDRSEKFFEEFEKMLDFLTEKPIMISSPFFSLTKTEMVEWYIEEGHPIDLLLKTRSCYSVSELPCGNCSACFRRWIALQNNNLSEKYENDILGYHKIPKYIEKMKNGMYDSQRTTETFDALRKANYPMERVNT